MVGSAGAADPRRLLQCPVVSVDAAAAQLNLSPMHERRLDALQLVQTRWRLLTSHNPPRWLCSSSSRLSAPKDTAFTSRVRQCVHRSISSRHSSHYTDHHHHHGPPHLSHRVSVRTHTPHTRLMYRSKPFDVLFRLCARAGSVRRTALPALQPRAGCRQRRKHSPNCSQT